MVYAGHMSDPTGKNSQGALSASGAREYLFNDAVLRAMPEEAGTIRIHAVLASENVPLELRARRARELGAAVVVEVHHDSAQPSDIASFNAAADPVAAWTADSGFSVFVRPGSHPGDASTELALAIARELEGAGMSPNGYHARAIAGEGRAWVDEPNGVYSANFQLLRDAEVPAVIVECGVIANPSDERELASDDVRRRVAQAIAVGIAAYAAHRGEP